MSRRVLRPLDAAWPVLSLALGVFVLVAVLGNANGEIVTDVIQTLLTVTMTLGLYIFVGNSGVISLGNAGFMGVGAYVGGIASIPLIQRGTLLPFLPDWATKTELALWPAALLAAVVAGLIGYVIAIPVARLSGLAAAVATLAVLQIGQVVMVNWKVIAGDGGATPGIPVDTTTWAAYTAVLIALVIAWLYQRSASGIRLRASREDLVAARSVGVDIARERRRAFAIGSAITGLGGALYAHSVGTVAPADFFILTGFLQLAMLVVGGITSMAGAVVGVVSLSILTNLIQRLQDGERIGPISVSLPNGIDTVIVAIILLIVLVKRPSGLTGGREFRLPRRLRARLAGPGAVVPAGGPGGEDPDIAEAGIAAPDVAVAGQQADAGPDVTLPARQG
ncbi:MAG: branched-chain amino acid transport system permease protein [Solirubrobacteraceae bacterium]|nr:branched-chain amino acid transport system permease protein [Solirubrobacteraceae bacterium]